MASISTSQVNLWVPRDIGLFKKHGLDVDLVLISGAPIVNAALCPAKSSLPKEVRRRRFKPISKALAPISF
jgi:hypothetical protein